MVAIHPRMRQHSEVRTEQTLDDPGLEELVGHLSAGTPMPVGTARRLVDEVLAALTETVEDYVRRRHRELQGAGMANAEIFARLKREIPGRRFRVPVPSERQLRRMVYG